MGLVTRRQGQSERSRQSHPAHASEQTCSTKPARPRYITAQLIRFTNTDWRPLRNISRISSTVRLSAAATRSRTSTADVSLPPASALSRDFHLAVPVGTVIHQATFRVGRMCSWPLLQAPDDQRSMRWGRTSRRHRFPKLYASTLSCSRTSFARNRWHDSRVQCVTCLPSLIHGSAVPRLLSNRTTARFGSGDSSRCSRRAETARPRDARLSPRLVWGWPSSPPDTGISCPEPTACGSAVPENETRGLRFRAPGSCSARVAQVHGD